MFSLIATEENGNKFFATHSYACLSTDTKKTEDIKNGSFLIEMDTKKIYVFDEDNTQWREIA